LRWNASIDNTGVVDYLVQRNGVTIAVANNVGTVPSFVDRNVFPEVAYSYVVLARDAAGNVSAPSTAANATLPAATDTQAPSVPQGLVATSVSSSEIDLSWAASTDNIGVAGYEILRDNVKIGTSKFTTFGDATLSPGTSYTYVVVAVDGAGNRSASSSAVSATTSSAADSISLVTLSKAATSKAKAISISRPASVTPGMLMVVSVDVRGVPKVTAPTGWALVTSSKASSGKTMVKYTFSRIASTSEPSAYTFRFDSSHAASGLLVAASGVASATPKATTKVNSSSNKISASSITTFTPGSLVLGFFGLANDGNISAPSNMTGLGKVISSQGSSDVASQVSWRALPQAAATGTETASSDKSAIGIGQLIVIEPAR
jgi:chitodextrinase